MTLAACIRHHESAQEPRQTVVTPLGAAITAGTRFVTTVAASSDRERATVLSTIVAELKAIEPVTA